MSGELINGMEPEVALDEAIKFATVHHYGQKRKGTDIPYIVHPLEVLTLLSAMDASTEVMIAGVLHDTVEDTDATIDDIRAAFGDDVAALVEGHTEDKSRTWEERKSAAIKEAEEAPYDLKCIILADKLSNLRAIARDYEKLGDKVWERFNAPFERQSWYYLNMIRALEPLGDIPETAIYFDELCDLHTDVFPEYQYYYIKDLKLFARGRDLFDNYIYRNGKWEKDEGHIVCDRLIGYDPNEDVDSPNKVGNTEVLMQLEKISGEEFKKRIKD